MDQQKVPFDKPIIDRFIRAVALFAASEAGWKAKILFAGLVALMFGINGMNVLNSYVGCDFMTAIADRNKPEFIFQAMLYIGVFAASTVISVVSRFIEESLGLRWREFITKQAVGNYLANGTYYRLVTSGELKNPDQRIADDVRAFTVTTLSFVLMILNSSLTILAFSGVVWSISPLLFGVALVYAAFGSYMAIVLGRPLVKLNYDQLDKDANFRSTLIHVRENAESILLAHREERLGKRLLSRFDNLVGNFRNIIAINRNLGFFTGGYYWLIGIIPALIVAPAYMDGQIEFGVITQSAMAFSALVGAFSLVVTQIQSISSFTAVVSRLYSLSEAIERTPSESESTIQIRQETGRVAYERLTLLAQQDGQCLLKELSVSIPSGRRVLILGSGEAATVALFKATAGVSVNGHGLIIRPDADALFFLAEKPYLPHGTLRELLVRASQEREIADARLLGLLRDWDLEDVLARAGGLDKEQDWGSILTLGEQQLLAFIHVLLAAPRFVFLGRIDTALSNGQVRKILEMLSAHAITYIHIGGGGETPDLYDEVLEIREDGSWI